LGRILGACGDFNFLDNFGLFHECKAHVVSQVRSQVDVTTEFIDLPVKMSSSKTAPQQFKQPSRKGKKAWRKNVDITEVQGGLERLRDEIVQG
jgi:hypothetical protein